MSHSLPPLSSLTRRPPASQSMASTPLPPLRTMTSYRKSQPIPSSSPARSSSPVTPSSSRYSHQHPYIQSSPVMGGGAELPPLRYRSDDPPSHWLRPDGHLPVSLQRAAYGRISKPKYSFYDEPDFPPSSDFDIEDQMDDADMSLPEMDSETTSESTPGHGSTYFSDSEEEGDMYDGADGYGNGGLRATFLVSSERGRWKDDPMALTPTTTAGWPKPARQSLPPPPHPSSTTSTITRPVSEPLASSQTSESPLSSAQGHDRIDDSHGHTIMTDPVAREQEPGSTSRCPSPGPGAKEVTPEYDVAERYSSPLPSSSPPLSPLSACVSSISRSVSPLLFAPSSPVLMPQSSPCPTTTDTNALQLEAVPPHDATVDVRPGVPSEDEVVEVVVDNDAVVEDVKESEDVVMDVTPARGEDGVLGGQGADKEAEAASVVGAPDGARGDVSEGPEEAPAVAIPMEDEQAEAVSLPEHPVVGVIAAVSNPGPNPQPTTTTTAIIPSTSSKRAISPDENEASTSSKPKVVKSEDARAALTVQDDNVDADLEVKQPPQEKKKAGKRKSAESVSRVAKKQKVEASSSSASPSPAPEKPKTKKAKVVAKVVEKEESDYEDDAAPEAGPSTASASSPSAKSKPAKSGKTTKPTKASKSSKSSAAAGSSSRRSAAPQFLPDSPQKPGYVDSPPEAIDEEMKGMLIECMATSRASSLAVSVLCRLVLEAHPALREQREEREWKRVMNRVLCAGMAPRGSGVFGRVESSGKDDSDRPLEAQWFYVPELDEDQDRAALIRSMMPRPAKRNETKKYKQYYWRPLAKISRWDPEDDL